MRLSQYFIPMKHHVSNDVKLASHQLSLKAGLIQQLASGIYSWLPLGYRVIKKIEKLIIDEMEQIGANEILMPSIHPAELWQESGRYNEYGDEMLKFKDRHNRDFLFGPTHEEVVTDIFRKSIKSYKVLPLHLVQTQWKFRDEIRPRHGVMRSREFLMKDSYSFDLNQTDAEQTYRSVFAAYLRIFKKIGLKVLPTRADSGAIGGDLSHEIQIISKHGENKIFCDKPLEELIGGSELADYRNHYIASDDYHKDDGKNYHHYNGIEIGHLFYFGTKYTEKMNAVINDNNGKLFFPHMGSYGIGVSRLIGAIIEASHDEHGIVWPEKVAPFQVAVINLKTHNEKCKQISQEIYQQLQQKNIETLMDDTNNTATGKLKNIATCGIPHIIIIGNTYLQNGIIEIQERKTMQKQEVLSIEEMNKVLNNKLK